MNRLNPNYWIGLWILCYCTGCGPIAPEEYRQWVEDPDNGLVQHKEAGDYRYELQYRPLAYSALQHYGPSMQSAELDTYTKENGGLQYLELKLSPKNGKDLLQFGAQSEEDLQRRAYHFSYRMQERIFLEQQGQRFPCVLYHFERSFDLKPGRTFLLGFAAAPEKTGIDCKVIIEDPFLGSDRLSFHFKQDTTPNFVATR